MSDTYKGDLNVGATTVTCTGATAHYATGCDLLLHYANGDGEITTTEVMAACADYNAGLITLDEANFVTTCWTLPSPNVNNACPGCYCSCTPWVNAECTAIGKRRQTRTCTPAGCDIEERIIDDASCKPNGDITKVTLDGKLLPEDGTLDWILNDDAHVRVFFKNTGNVASAFRIWLTDDTGVPAIITDCDKTTSSIPADGAEYYIDLCVFLPDIVEVKTLTAHIDP